MTVFVDDRYRGSHGIGRYAAEVLPRLTVPWQSLGLSGSPFSPVDAFRPTAARDGALVYSPGYGALVRAPRQLLTLHDLIQLSTPGIGRWKFAAYYAGPVRNVVRRAGVVLTVSETSASALRSWVDDDDVEIVNAGNGCSAAFHPGAGAGPQADPYLLFVGNGRAHKNFDVVLDALALARDARLVAVVPHRGIGDLRARATHRGVDARVRWVSGVDDEGLADLYRGAAATVMPSTLEGFGLPALESVRCGTPVIHWVGCESVAEIVADRGAAVSSSADAGEWAEALRDALATARRVEAPDGYDWDRTAGIVSETIARFGD
ncbi:glycosyltransferase family 1 protein [Microbacterium sp. 1.5R]|uniref:glycosyltransferase family 4 protein n=1 Tax=Microbacterium sp. 1.5R TaxID=1916917 RepID=UPI0011A53B28|nr:glycosyltransferase family 1 protein [Microbacterium sp. 1.5R]